MKKQLTYISLFSSAGVGCYGFKKENFECIATNELIPRRLEIQKFNNKCKYQSGYICGDITQKDIQSKLFDEVDLWKKNENLERVDVVIATPPCQGMSVANHKKKEDEIVRNSLVVESIKIVQKLNPKFFVFENVPAFMKTICTDIDGNEKPISEAIEYSLGNSYSYVSRVINFKNYGACSSRQRTVVIGVSNDYAEEVSPYELYPDYVFEPTLRDVIGDLKPLSSIGEIDPEDIYHSFRKYPEHMRSWIHDLKEGESAFDNEDDEKKPHQMKDGKLVLNKRKNADKYTRQYWDKVGPCIHTRNDQLASQNTVHPSDDRVFSVRELMRMMTVPDDFKWVEKDEESLNDMSLSEKEAFLKKEEIKIRQSLGEAVPTTIFRAIAHKIRFAIGYIPLTNKTIERIRENYDLTTAESIYSFVKTNPLGLSVTSLSKIAELTNTNRTDNAAYYTNKTLVTDIIRSLPDTDKECIRILEPSVGVGNFIPLICKKFENKRVTIDVVDIDKDSIQLLKLLLKKLKLPKTIKINYIVDDFLLHDFDNRYDYIIGNPPFYKMSSKDGLLKIYKRYAINKSTNNICSFFLDKAQSLGDNVALVFPKFLLNTPEFAPSREYLSKKSVPCIIDFGENGFPGVLIETIALFVNNLSKPSKTKVISKTNHVTLIQSQKYIFDDAFPYWIIYRNDSFDDVCKKLSFDVFNVFRDRQITNKVLSSNDDIRVIKSRNISDDGKMILDIDGYDSYISSDCAQSLSVYQFLDNDNVFLTPNMTYKPRVIQKPKRTLVNGSVAILLPKANIAPTEEQLSFFSTDEYRGFYQIARNYQTRSLNVDACSVFFFGLLRKRKKSQPIVEKKVVEKNSNQLSFA